MRIGSLLSLVVLAVGFGLAADARAHQQEQKQKQKPINLIFDLWQRALDSGQPLLSTKMPDRDIKVSLYAPSERNPALILDESIDVLGLISSRGDDTLFELSQQGKKLHLVNTYTFNKDGNFNAKGGRIKDHANAVAAVFGKQPKILWVGKDNVLYSVEPPTHGTSGLTPELLVYPVDRTHPKKIALHPNTEIPPEIGKTIFPATTANQLKKLTSVAYDKSKKKWGSRREVVTSLRRKLK